MWHLLMSLISVDPGLADTFLGPPGAGFMKGLKSGLRLKSETLGSNVVNILLSL